LSGEWLVEDLKPGSPARYKPTRISKKKAGTTAWLPPGGDTLGLAATIMLKNKQRR
jgi:hypothetical protein